MRLDITPVRTFQESLVPSKTRLAGWTALVQALSLKAPVRQPSCVSEKHVRGSQREEGIWRAFDKRYWPGDNLADHLIFALRHEDLDLLILKRAFDAMPAKALEELIAATPTGIPARRIWFFYEWLTGRTLDLPDAHNVAAVDALDPQAYFTAKPRLSRRHRVRDNLLGTGRFCPVIRRTKTLTGFVDLGLAEKARETVGRTAAQLVARAASFLLLADSRASFEIEGERVPRNRLERWGRAIMQAVVGKRVQITLEDAQP